MFRIVKGFLVLFCIFAVGTLVAEAANLEQVDQLIMSKQVPQIERAINLLEKHLKENINDGQALWLMGKAHLYLGDRIKDNVLATFERGKDFADQAVEILPNSPDAHFWRASLMGRIGQTRGILQSLFMVKPMHESLELVIELDENYADAYYVLSQLYQQAPGFPLSIGNKKLALEMAYKSIELDGKNLDYPIQLARALEHNGRRKEAVEVLQELLARPAAQRDLEIKEEAEELLAELTA